MTPTADAILRHLRDVLHDNAINIAEVTGRHPPTVRENIRTLNNLYLIAFDRYTPGKGTQDRSSYHITPAGRAAINEPPGSDYQTLASRVVRLENLVAQLLRLGITARSRANV